MTTDYNMTIHAAADRYDISDDRLNEIGREAATRLEGSIRCVANYQIRKRMFSPNGRCLAIKIIAQDSVDDVLVEDAMRSVRNEIMTELFESRTTYKSRTDNTGGFHYEQE